MGQIVNLKCQKCGYEETLWLGAGMTFNNLESVIGLFDKQAQEKIKETVKNNPNTFWSVSKEIGVCNKCGKISAVAVFKMAGAAGKTVEYRARCQCGNEVDILDMEKILGGQASISCPACHDPLEITVAGHWD